MTAPAVHEPKVERGAATAGGAVETKRAPQMTTYAPGTVIGFKWLEHVFKPAPFLVGALLGFAICCALGYATTLKNQFGDIQRFGIFVGPQASFFPTISQLINVVKSRIKPEQTLVLVGGSSILNGVGQSNDELWTKRLQQHLGPKYVVVNLALRSCNSYEGAYFVAEAMAKQHKKTIFVTSALPSVIWHPMGCEPYAYLYWDAKYHDLLEDFPDRENAILAREKELPDQVWKPETLTELKLSQWLNARLHFLELWNTCGYRYFFTSFRAVTDDASFWPRRKLPNNAEAYEKFPLPSDEFAKKYFRSICERLAVWDSEKKLWVKERAFFELYANSVKQNVAPQMRPRTLSLLIWQNPELRRKYLPADLNQRDKVAYDSAEAALRDNGMPVMQVGSNYEGKDFRDTMHLGATGGYKLAQQTAIEVRKIAKQLGYEE